MRDLLSLSLLFFAVGCFSADDLPSAGPMDGAVALGDGGPDGAPESPAPDGGPPDSAPGDGDAMDAAPDGEPPDEEPDGGDEVPAVEAGPPPPDAGPDGGEDPPPEGDYPIQLALARYHSCALMKSGVVYCWGADNDGQLGDGDTVHSECGSHQCSPEPVRVSELAGVRQISAGIKTSCAIHDPGEDAQGSLSCWGVRIGIGDEVQAPTALVLGSVAVTGVKQVSVGALNACALRDSKPPICWGDDYTVGELGSGKLDAPPAQGINVATELAALAEPGDLLSVAVGNMHACALLSSRSLLCWGGNRNGRAGQDLAQEIVYTPSPVVGATEVTRVSAGSDHTCFTSDEEPECFGMATWGQLGTGQTYPDCYNNPCQPTPTKIVTSELSAAVDQLSLGEEFSCARTADHKAWCWGHNDYGQLGPKVLTEAALEPAPVRGKVRYIAAGSYHACAILDDYSVECWGNNDAGQIGAAPEVLESAEPVKVMLPK